MTLLRLLLLALALTIGLGITACCFFMGLGAAAVYLLDDLHSGDADVDAKKISKGMSKDEVRAILGKPNREGQDRWTYYYGRFSTSEVLEVCFGADNRVTSIENWVQ